MSVTVLVGRSCSGVCCAQHSPAATTHYHKELRSDLLIEHVLNEISDWPNYVVIYSLIYNYVVSISIKLYIREGYDEID